MITIETLMQMAMFCDLVHKARVDAGFGPGTVDKTRNDAFRNLHKCLNYAAWMEQHGLSEHIGIDIFVARILVRGQKVRIRKGAKIRTTHPQFRDGKVAKANHTVTIHSFDEGYLPHYNESGKVREAQVTWAGAGGYWCTANLSDVELID